MRTGFLHLSCERPGGRPRKILDDLIEAGVRVPPRPQAELASAGALPPWLGEDTVHRSHRSALLRKEPSWYGPRFGDDPPDLPYTWPVRHSSR